MAWEVEFTDQFSDWFDELREQEQDRVATATWFFENGGLPSEDRSSTQ